MKRKSVKIEPDLHRVLTKMKRGSESINDVIFSMILNRPTNEKAFTTGMSTSSPRSVYKVDKVFGGVDKVDIIVGVSAILGIFGFLFICPFLMKKFS